MLAVVFFGFISELNLWRFHSVRGGYALSTEACVFVRLGRLGTVPAVAMASSACLAREPSVRGVSPDRGGRGRGFEVVFVPAHDLLLRPADFIVCGAR